MASLAALRRPDRSRVLVECGAASGLLDELLAYNERPFDRQGGSGAASLPLGDEPHLKAWSEYEAHARAVGAFASLKDRFFQLQFPIREGISREDVYRRATLRGIAPSPFDRGTELELNRPQDLQLVLNPTAAGRVPLLIVPDRGDFVTLVRAFTGRNEPIPVPDSMGACIVSGLNNWDRIARHRERWIEEHADDEAAGSWDDEFERIIPKKELYQDRFIILSTGPYSFVPASAVGLAEDEWRRQSLVIRREHECTHYLMYRALGSMKNNLQDEVIADFVGLAHAFRSYPGDMALRFFGLENHPQYREGGRLESYCGDPRLTDASIAVVREMVFRTVRNLEEYTRENPEWLNNAAGITRLTLALAGLTLEELASPGMPGLLDAELEAIAPPSPLAPVPDSLWIHVGESEEGMARLLEEFDVYAGAHPRLGGVRGDLSLALDELVSNVIHHGSDDEDGETRSAHAHVILVGLTVGPDHVELQIIDDADCFSPLDAPAPDLEKPIEDRPIGGLGIHLVKRLMDGMEYRRYAGRNHLVLRKNLPAL